MVSRVFYGRAVFFRLWVFALKIDRHSQVEAVVRERFGGPACRIFRLLLLKRNLEQKQIAEMVRRDGGVSSTFHCLCARTHTREMFHRNGHKE